LSTDNVPGAAAIEELDVGKLKDQPLVEAAVREIIGNTLWGLSRYTEAEVNLRRALEIRRRVLPSTHPEIATNLFELASALRDKGKLAEAEALSREALWRHRNTSPTVNVGGTLFFAASGSHRRPRNSAARCS
jgi:tetratricopeptide (TPR) repeat protein